MDVKSKSFDVSTSVEQFMETKVRLAQCSKELMEAHSLPNKSGYNIIRKYCTPDFVMENASIHQCAVPFADRLETHLDNVSTIKQLNPEWRVNVSNVTPVWDNPTHEITVWYTSGPSGGSESDWSTNRESVGILHWRRGNSHDGDLDDWKCYKHSSIRGGANLDGIL